MQHPKEKLDTTAMVTLVILCASWGLQQISIKIAIEGIPPLMQAGMRSVGAGVLVFMWISLRKRNLLAKDGSLGWGIAIGLIFSVEFVMIY